LIGSLKGIVLLPALLFVAMGLRWLVDPQGAAEQAGFALAHGLGRSTQVADFAAFFLAMGLCLLLGLVSGRRLWFYPPCMLLLLAAISRILVWALHDAALALEIVAFELVVAALVLIASRWITEEE